jgi:uncharacterized membrane protein
VTGPAKIIFCAHRRQAKKNIATAARGVCSITNRNLDTKEVNNMRLTQNLGMLLLAIWLILYGLIALLGLSFSGLGVIMAILAIAAGVLILLGR